MGYAPILIPTCNRITHLRRCVESLAKNKLAIDTDIYISVDYPPSPKYEDGYQDVVKFVKNGINGFNSVHTYIQEKNLGPSNNIEFLYKACQPHEKWILTEDDNEFSPNFLEYMNSGLDYYELDDSVLFICAYLEGKEVATTEYNCYTSSYYQPYGSACWRHKFKLLMAHQDKVVLDPDKRKLKNAIWMYKTNPWCFMVYVNHILLKQKKKIFWKTEHSLNPVDGVIQLYLLFTGKTSLFPTVSKSKTWGNDGSGFTMIKDDSLTSVHSDDLDKDSDFIMRVCMNHNQPKVEDALFSKWQIAKLWIKYVLFRLGYS